MQPHVAPLGAIFDLNTTLLLNCLDGLSDGEARQRLQAGGNSITFLAGHLTDSRHFLVSRLGQPLPNPLARYLEDVRRIEDIRTWPSLDEIRRPWRGVSDVLRSLEPGQLSCRGSLSALLMETIVPSARLHNRSECPTFAQFPRHRLARRRYGGTGGGGTSGRALNRRVPSAAGRSADRVRAELAALSRALVPPVLGKFAVRDEGFQLTTPEPELTTFWLVAQDPDGTVVFYDEAADEFGLGEATPEGDLETVGVRGDLLSGFLAR